MTSSTARIPAAEVDKHRTGSAEQRVRAALRWGEELLDLFLATQPPGTTRADARAMMQRNRHSGRRPSKVTGTLQ